MFDVEFGSLPPEPFLMPISRRERYAFEILKLILPLAAMPDSNLPKAPHEMAVKIADKFLAELAKPIEIK